MSKEKLNLLADSLLDVHILSSLIESSVICKEWYKFNKEKKTFTIFLNRFCWEIDPDPYDNLYYRNHSILSFENVLLAKNNFNDNGFKSIECMICNSNNLIKIIMNNDYQIDLHISEIKVYLKDTVNYWITKSPINFKKF